ncbi:hypothetical protein [Spirosoma endbachense]|uniref:Uncharacterized protein n=1 Tax=Spirosoma endbachense TaxID=2666025 RepID=A0A6P1VV61_9BACT|nr:hypothetical protein [Spirosoma endbachense]QHV96973.1 hypothetical protein GJR95_19040 [Spirosoma endbachense]
MKHIFCFRTGYWIALLICTTTIPSWAQYGPFVGANTIVLSTSLADKDAYLVITQVLTAESLSFSAEKDVLRIRSLPTSILTSKGLVFEGRLWVNTGVVKLMGQLLEGSNDGTGSVVNIAVPITYTKGRTFRQRMGFSYMDELAKKLQTGLKGSIAYKHQPAGTL